ncbi:MAG: exopolysaccharide biosynthesis GT4 family glycosyltransferase EpsE [Pseudomonadota bacterium]|nr:exopolysaccharide biosynthesis GT4 family glycosyltransferase EpsE [Pseudomonadota bacterium]
MCIGYLIPEFPGQTHNFFWRERQALRELGVDTRLISTRRPPKGIASPSWAEEAAAQTVYLLPFSVPDTVKALAVILAAGPLAWFRCLKLVAGAAELSIKQKLRLAALIPFAAKLVAIGRAERWRHVHVHSCADAANVALFACVLSDMKYSITLHNPLDTHGPNQAQKWLHALFAIVITRKIHAEVTQRLQGFLPRRMEIAPMGVDVEKFRRTAPYIPYQDAGELAIFSCGRLNPGKGYPYLIAAVDALKQQGLAVRLEIAGEDDQGGSGYRKVLEARIAEAGLEDSVILLGAVAEEQVMRHLESAHVFALASLAEPLGVVIMEAMAMNVPVVATNGGGVSELVADGVDGILVNTCDADALAEAIARIARDPELAGRLSAASREKVMRGFSHRRSAQTIAALLDAA